MKPPSRLFPTATTAEAAFSSNYEILKVAEVRSSVTTDTDDAAYGASLLTSTQVAEYAIDPPWNRPR